MLGSNAVYLAFTSAPASNSADTIAVTSKQALSQSVMHNGLAPSRRQHTFTSQPASISKTAHSECPNWMAKCKGLVSVGLGVLPVGIVCSRSTPARMYARKPRTLFVISKLQIGNFFCIDPKPSALHTAS